MMEYFAGLDVSLRSCALCIVDSKGATQFERIDFEAGTMRQHLYLGLKAEGFDVICMEAHGVRALLSPR